MDQKILAEVTDPDAIHELLLWAKDVPKKDVQKIRNWLIESQRIKMDAIPHFQQAQVDAQRRVFTGLLAKLEPKQKK